MSYMRDVEPDHFDTHNNPVGTHLRHCMCRATLQYMNADPKQCRKYSRSHLILPHGAQYKERLFPEILEPWNHREPLTDSSTKEPFPMELVGDFWVADPIFKGCYGDSLLYSDAELHQLRWWKIHLPAYWGEIPVPLAPSYWQARQPEVMKQSPPRAATPNPSVESPKTINSSSKGGPHHSSGCSSNISKVPRLYFSQEALQFQGANLKWPGEVSQGLWLLQAWPLPFPICRVSQTQTERCLHGRHPHTQLNPPHQLQHL